MKKIALFLSCVLCVSSFAGGWFARGKFTDGSVRVVTETKTVREWKYKDVPSLPVNQQFEIYKQCYFSPIEIDGIVRENALHIKAYTSCQSAQRDFVLECDSDDNFKFYVGLAAGGVIVGGLGYTAYRSIR